MELYDKVSLDCSKLITQSYSTSFSLGIRMFHKSFRTPICAIYGFVRFADEIVDTFHSFDKKLLLEDFKRETFEAIDQGISLNPVLQSFQWVVNMYSIRREYIEAFFTSMEMDLFLHRYDVEQYKQYIYGSAEVIGLMCLQIFCEGDERKYESLKDSARYLGAAFQKINFLRDIKSDFEERGRTYFPGIDFRTFSEEEKSKIQEDIAHDFAEALKGIKKLPIGARLGVYLAYIYYTNLFKKIKRSSANVISQKRIRVSDRRKVYLLATTTIRHHLNLL